MKQPSLFCAVLLLWTAGCNPPTAPTAAGSSVKTYAGHGVVRQISADRHTATIEHDAFPGYMSAMTMDFNVKATNELSGIAPDDEINFKLVVGADASWIEDIHFVSHRIENVTNGVVTLHMTMPDLKPGDLLPDYEFTTETGGKVHIADFRGRALAFTFFFTRCPLPDFCPRMSRDFSDARQLLLNTPNAPTNWEFFSISFDSAFDQPAVLSAYANSFREGNADRWLFAAASPDTLADLAPKLDLMVTRAGEGFSHNLRTVVLDPQGRIFCQFDGNSWVPQKLADAILAAARGEPAPAPPKVQAFDE